MSHILLHELSYKAIHNVYKECFRLLKSGGYMLHLDLPPKKDVDTVTHFHIDWDTHFQAEPFVTTLTELDLDEVAAKAGFDKRKTFEDYVPTLVPAFDTKRHLFGARKQHERDSETIDPGEARPATEIRTKLHGVDQISWASGFFRRAALTPQLRHTHATILMRQGINPKVVSERLGHAKVATTLDIYSHVLPGMQEEAALQIERALGGAADAK